MRPPASLREVLDRNLIVSDAQELFYFGLLQYFDMLQLAKLSFPLSH